MSHEPTSSSPSVDDALIAALRRLRRGAGTALGAASLIGAAAPLAACVETPDFGAVEQADWAQFEGQRNTAMVSYTGAHWGECKQYNGRFGCGAFDIFVKVRIKPVAGVDLAWKKVGVVYHTPDDGNERTAVGYFAGALPGGDEEWLVPVRVPSWQTTILFDAWYQDGAGHTYLDDNQGELHLANEGPSYNILRVEPWQGTVVVDDYGVRGKVSVQVADLDFDKQIALVGTVDDWATTFDLGQAPAGSGAKNAWHWVEDYQWSNRERWEIDLDLPAADVQRFQYAVVYRHGVANGAKTYEAWDNNWNSNYIVERVVPQAPTEPTEPTEPGDPIEAAE